MTDINYNEKESDKEYKENEPIDISKDANNNNLLKNYKSTKGPKTEFKNLKSKKLHERKCPYCKQEYKTEIGINNWKNLFRKPTLDDWIVLIIIILILIASYAYTLETKACKETLANLDQICMQRKNNVTYTGNGVPVVPYIPYIGNPVNESDNLEVNSSDSKLDITGNITEDYSINQNTTNVSG